VTDKKADKKVTRVVVHPRYYQKVKGVMVHVAPGTEVEVTEAQAERAGVKLAAKGDAKALKGGQLVDSSAGGNVAELTAQLSGALAKNADLEKEVAKLKKAAG